MLRCDTIKSCCGTSSLLVKCRPMTTIDQHSLSPRGSPVQQNNSLVIISGCGDASPALSPSEQTLPSPEQRPGFRGLVASQAASSPITKQEYENITHRKHEGPGHKGVPAHSNSQLATLSGAMVHNSSSWHGEDKLVTLQKRTPKLLPSGPVHTGRSAKEIEPAALHAGHAKTSAAAGLSEDSAIIDRTPSHGRNTSAGGVEVCKAKFSDPDPMQPKVIWNIKSVCCSACLGAVSCLSSFFV